jgi:uncharacterized membrane protein (UPF0127 family)
VAWLVVGERVLASAEVASTRRARRTGLLGTDGIEGGLVLERCRWVHTLGMRYAIDVAYLDRDGVVLKTVRMHPHRVGLPQPRSACVIEAEAGAFGRWGLHVGDVVELR